MQPEKQFSCTLENQKHEISPSPSIMEAPSGDS